MEITKPKTDLNYLLKRLDNLHRRYQDNTGEECPTIYGEAAAAIRCMNTDKENDK